MKSDAFTPRHTSLSLAWAELLLRLMERGASELSMVTTTITEFSNGHACEHARVRSEVDEAITRMSAKHPQLKGVETVANTIFPRSMWNPTLDSASLYARFERAWPQLRKCRANVRGSYFRRLTAFRPVDGEQPVNQLKHIAETYRRGNHRRTALQASIFDPALDHLHSRRQGFPCLQHIAFDPAGDGLSLTAFYATQYIFDRAYGNYLGLCRLGQFMASELGLKFVRLTCIASVAQLGSPSKNDLQPMVASLRTALDAEQEDRNA